MGNRLPCISHDCNGSQKRRRVDVKDNQSLRNLRHVEGCRKEHSAVFQCQTCQKEWSSREAALSSALESNATIRTRLSQMGKDVGSSKPVRLLDLCSSLDDLRGARYHTYMKKMSEELIFYSRFPGKETDVSDVANSLYNIHDSAHVKGCFKEGYDECRYKFPKKANGRTKVEYTECDDMFYDFNGGSREMSMVRIVPRRGKADVCSNSFCSAISRSKIACNSNVTTVHNMRMSHYMTKYITKSQPLKDAGDFESMGKFIANRFVETKFEDPVSESLSRTIGSCLAHNADNLISAPMAKFLVNNGSRFGKSHEIQYVPLMEMKKWMQSGSNMSLQVCPCPSDEKGNASSEVRARSESARPIKFFMQSQGLHYLQRPQELEDVSALSFYSEYVVCRKGRSGANDGNCFEFPESHPGHSYQCLKERSLPVIPGVNNYHFVDCKQFNGDILDVGTEIGELEEDYACMVLLLLHPFRSKSDIQFRGSYVQKYRTVFNDIVKPHSELLQNIQNIRNGSRQPREEDDLEQVTEAFASEETKRIGDDEEDVDHDEDFGRSYEEMLISSLLSVGFETIDNIANSEEQVDSVPSSLKKMNFDEIRCRGSNRCGLTGLYPSIGSCTGTFLEYDTEDTETTSTMDVGRQGDDRAVEDRLTIEHMAAVLSMHVTTRVIHNPVTPSEQENDVRPDPASKNGSRTFATYQSSQRRSVPEMVKANGSAESILKWSLGEEANFDAEQRQAFIVICAHFVMTFVDEVQVQNENDQTITAQGRSASLVLRRETTKLKKLCAVNDVLRMFLDGPGGSGKSRIVGEVLTYCKAFCSAVNVPFTSHSIMVTASTGVAATMVNGQTVHAGIGLERKCTSDSIANFSDVRMVIVDEVSMLSKMTLAKVDRKLRQLRDFGEYYGGIHMVFIGDFRQLRPIGSLDDAIYADETLLEWYDAINVYIELKGRYRFIDDREWGAILDRLRIGKVLPGDIDRINERVVDQHAGRTIDGDKVPPGIRYCTSRNIERDAINTGLFEDRVTQASDGVHEDELLVFSDSLQILRNSEEREFIAMSNPQQFYEECGEFDCKFPSRRSTRMDPVLKLYSGCPVMLTDNLDVENGMANGTEAIVSKIILKRDEKPMEISLGNGVVVRGVFAGQISEAVLLRKLDNREIPLKPTKFAFEAQFKCPPQLSSRKNRKVCKKMTAVQLPFIHNSATTGHKLQGATCESLYVTNFPTDSNWIYVALSRVRTISGLFLRQKLRADLDFRVDTNLNKMKQTFAKKKALKDKFLEELERRILKQY